jgi:phosphotransferase system enzyme I (PtsI)
MEKGIPGSPGIAIGKAYILEKETFCILEYNISANDVEAEIDRFLKAVEESKQQMLQLQREVTQKVDKREAYIFSIYTSILEDPLLIEGTIDRIRSDLVNAETALRECYKSLPEKFKTVRSEFMQERLIDIEYAGERILQNLLKRPPLSLAHLKENIIVVAYDLAPSETASMDKEKVLGFCTDRGGRTSHTAIMARALEIPAVVGLRDITSKVKPGTKLIVDGEHGRVIINPTAAQIRHYQELQRKLQSYRESLHSLVSLPPQTPDGREIELSANIAAPEEVDVAIRNGTEGVGLYRTEYLYMNRDSLPNEEEQLKAYRIVVEKTAPYSVIIRTLDIGGDKFLSALSVPGEINPFMGWRAIRLSLQQIEVFTTQLRAILRASMFGNVKVMFPLISSVEEVREAIGIFRGVEQKLTEEGLALPRNVEAGIMIEVPSAALMAEVLAKEVDFFSLGTNDLIQYTLAVDRGNEKVAHLYQPLHPSILRLIDHVIKSAHRENIWVGACGEMASEPLAMSVLIGLEIDELSVSPTSIPEIKKIIRSIPWVDFQRVARHVLKLSTSDQAKRYLKTNIGQQIRQLLKRG